MCVCVCLCNTPEAFYLVGVGHASDSLLPLHSERLIKISVISSTQHTTQVSQSSNQCRETSPPLFFLHALVSLQIVDTLNYHIHLYSTHWSLGSILQERRRYHLWKFPRLKTMFLHIRQPYKSSTCLCADSEDEGALASHLT